MNSDQKKVYAPFQVLETTPPILHINSGVTTGSKEKFVSTQSAQVPALYRDTP